MFRPRRTVLTLWIFALLLISAFIFGCDSYAPEPVFEDKDVSDAAVTLTAQDGDTFSYRAEELDEASCPFSVDAAEVTTSRYEPTPLIGKVILLEITGGEAKLEAEDANGEVWIELFPDADNQYGNKYLITTKDGRATLKEWCGHYLPPPPPTDG